MHNDSISTFHFRDFSLSEAEGVHREQKGQKSESYRDHWFPGTFAPVQLLAAKKLSTKDLSFPKVTEISYKISIWNI